MTLRVGDDLTRDLGGGRTLTALADEGDGWYLLVHEGGSVLGKIRLNRWMLARITKGRSYGEKELEVRGLRHEAEFRVAGKVVGRIRHSGLVELIGQAELTRTPLGRI